MNALSSWFGELNPLAQALALVPLVAAYWGAAALAALLQRVGAKHGFLTAGTGRNKRALPDMARHLTALGTSALFYWYLAGGRTELIRLVLLGVLTYYLARLIDRAEGRRRFHYLVLSLGVVVGWLVYGKYLALVTEALNAVLGALTRHQLPLLHVLAPLGISYYVFRMIAYLVETYWEEAPPVSLPFYLHYLTFFPALLAGPIERIATFHEQDQTARWSGEALQEGFGRIVQGIAMKVILADLVGGLLLGWPLAHPETPRGYGVVLFYAYLLRLYWDFCGYSSIAIGVGRLYGYRLQENFDRPYLATNLQQFWQRWHMSLSFWIRDYLYYPIVTARVGRRWGIWWTAVALVGSMALCGLWHGASWSYLWWGIYHGVGLAVCAIYQDYKRRRLAGYGWLNHPGMGHLGRFVTLTFVSAGLWLFFDTGWTLPHAWLRTALLP